MLCAPLLPDECAQQERTGKEAVAASMLVQPELVASTSAQASATAPAEMSPRPQKSSGSAAPRDSVSQRADRAAATMPTGTFAQKISASSGPE